MRLRMELRPVLMLANSIIGVSVLSMPYCFQKCGLVLGCLVLCLNNVMTQICCHHLIQASLLVRKRSYETLAFHVYGAYGKLAVEFCIIGYLMGCCVAFFVVIGDLGPEIFIQMWNGSYDLYWVRISVLLGTAFLIILPLCLLKNVDSLNVICMISMGFYGILVLKVYSEANPFVDLKVWKEVALWKPSGVFQCIPIFSMALSCQTQVFEVYQSLPEPSLKRMDSVVFRAVNLCTCIYLAVGAFGYLAFHHHAISGNVLVSLSSSILTGLTKLGFLLSVVLSFPIVVLPCRSSLYSMLHKKTNDNTSFTVGYIPDDKFRQITVWTIVITLALGIFIPNVEFILGLVGSTIGTLICVIFPALLHFQLASTNKLSSRVMLFIGVMILISGTVATIFAEEEYSSSHSTPPLAIRAEVLKDGFVQGKLTFDRKLAEVTLNQTSSIGIFNNQTPLTQV